MKKAICSILVILFVFSLFPAESSAHGDRKEHFNDIEHVLFGKNYKTYYDELPIDTKRKVRAIEYASILTLDQYNETDHTLLMGLEKLGVPDLPKNVTDTKDEYEFGINYRSYPNEHRKYTHRGWDYLYSDLDDIANWPVRKNILLNTARVVFKLDNFTNDKESQGYAFCALVYYIHIIGDQEKDSQYADCEKIIPLGRNNAQKTQKSSNTSDVFLELEYYLPRLFKEQQGSVLYIALMLRLKMLSKQVRKLDENGKVTGKDNIDKYQTCAKKMMKVLRFYIPKLLKNESFFTAVFP